MRDVRRSRYEQRHRRRKINMILNTLIAIVLLLIIIVSYQIFFSANDPDPIAGEGDTQQVMEENKNLQEKDKEEPGMKDNAPAKTEEKKDSTPQDGVSDKPSGQQDEVIVKEGGDDPYVIETIINPNWEPIGTVQTGKHVTVYDGVDWEEMVQAISYAVGIPDGEFTIHFLGNNGPNKSVGTIYTKNKEKIYRVYIEWVDGKGWKPTKVEVLSAIP